MGVFAFRGNHPTSMSPTKGFAPESGLIFYGSAISLSQHGDYRIVAHGESSAISAS